MAVYSFYIFDRHAECIYKKKFYPPGTRPPPPRPSTSESRPPSSSGGRGASIADGNMLSSNERQPRLLSAEDDAKLVFGTVFSLRNMVKKLGGPDDDFISYRTGLYKLHYYETPTSLKFVMITDVRTNSLRIVLHQIYVALFVEYVVKNPLSPTEHPGGEGVNCEMFELGLDQFVNGALQG